MKLTGSARNSSSSLSSTGWGCPGSNRKFWPPVGSRPLGRCVVPGHVDPQWDVGDRFGELGPHSLQDQVRLREDRGPFARRGMMKLIVFSTAIFPGDLAAQNLLPALAQVPELGIARVRPAVDIDQQRRLGQLLIGLEVLDRVPWNRCGIVSPKISSRARSSARTVR